MYRLRIRARRLVTLAVVAITSLVPAASATAATGISITGPASTTATIRNLTLTMTAFGTSNWDRTLSINLTAGRHSCGGGSGLVAIGSVTAGSAVVLTPAGTTALLLFPVAWSVNIRCTNGNVDVDGSSNPLLSLTGVGFHHRVNAITLLLAAGSYVVTLSAAGSVLTLTTASLTVTPGGTTTSMRGSYSLSPAIAYTLI